MNEWKTEDYENRFHKGYGFRARVGYLSPGLVDETLSAQFYRLAPAGVTMVRTSLELRDLTVDQIRAAVARAEKAATELRRYKPGCIIIGGSPTVAVGGYGYDKVLVERVQAASGITTFAAQAAAIEALRKYNVTKLAVASPFTPEVNVLVKDFLERSGFSVLSLEVLGVEYLHLTSTPLSATYELGKRAFEKARNADAIYFPGAPQPVSDNIQRLEEELGTTVVSSLQASMWKVLTMFKILDPVKGFGKLLSDR